MKNRGFTLIELLVVVGIIGVLAIALGFSFVGWQGRYRVESQIKEVESDLMKARARAMQRNRVHFFSLNPDLPSQYTVYEDDSDGTNNVPDGDGVFQPGTGDSADNELPSYPKTIDYDLTWNGTGDTVTFNTRGIITANRTICMFTDFDGDALHLSDVDPDYDCIVLSATRINLGKLSLQDTNGGVCGSAATGEGHCVQR